MEQMTIHLAEEDFVEWSRQALSAGLDFSEWVTAAVRRGLASDPAPRPEPRPKWYERDTPSRRDQPYYEECQYCGLPLPWDVTRRRQYCDDRCRVSAWRLRQRETRAT